MFPAQVFSFGTQVAIRNGVTRPLRTFILIALATLCAPLSSSAQERLCDTQSEDCRAPILDLIRNETAGIDVAFWFMEDARYVNELIKRHQAGVPVRVLVDQRANASKRLNETILHMLRDGGIPMRDKFGADVLHWKMMLFHGQDVVHFSKANFTDPSYVPITPNVNYFDEVVYFTGDDNLTNSFRRRFDDLWTDTSLWRNYANINVPLARHYPGTSIHPSMNFPMMEDFSNRSVARYDNERRQIDAIVYRVTDHRHAEAMKRAVARGATVRIITEPTEYRNRARLWHAKHVDRMYMGGVQIKHRRHEGLMHQASVVMHGLGEVIFGSSNWTTASASYQDEHNYFYTPSLGKPEFFQFFADQFEGKWNDTTNYVPFQPLPPDKPVYSAPMNSATGQSSSVTLNWEGGTWAHLYDIYFGTSPTPPLLESNKEIGSPVDGRAESFTVSDLLPGTTYYWRIVGKTWAQLEASGPVWSFTTSGTAPAGTPPPSGSTPYGGSAAAIPGTFEAENFDDGGQGVAYYDTVSGNSGGSYRSTDVDIQATTDLGGGFNLGWTKAGEWVQYTVNVTAAGSYRLEVRVANSGSGARFRVNVDGSDRTGAVDVPNTGGWQSWQTLSLPAISLSAGLHVVRVIFENVSSTGSVGNYNWFRFASDTSSGAVTLPAPSTSAFGGTPLALPGILQAENFDVGAQGVAYYDTSAGNSGGVYRATDVDVATTADPLSGGYLLGWARVGEWLTYTVNATESRSYAMAARLANVGSGATFRVEVDGVDRTGAIAVPNTGGWDTWQTVSLGDISLTEGLHVIRVVMLTRNVENSSVANFGYFSFQ